MNIDIRGFLKSSLNEWENRVCAVVFTARCNWRCAYCHGWRLVKEPEKLEGIEPEKIFSYLDSQRGWIDGLAITGGEPTLQPGLVEFIRRARGYGVQIKLESNGTRPEVLRELLEEKLVDCLAMDYKAPLDERLQKVAGVTTEATAVEKVRESYALAAKYKIEREYHTTLCPAFIDAGMIAEMGVALDAGGWWVLQQYELDELLDPVAAGEKRFGETELDEIEAAAKKSYGNVLLRRGKGS
jgi:pyruvate formate lyase activating enzyme